MHIWSWPIESKKHAFFRNWKKIAKKHLQLFTIQKKNLVNLRKKDRIKRGMNEAKVEQNKQFGTNLWWKAYCLNLQFEIRWGWNICSKIDTLNGKRIRCFNIRIYSRKWKWLCFCMWLAIICFPLVCMIKSCSLLDCTKYLLSSSLFTMSCQFLL